MVIVVKAAESSQAESVLHAKCTAFMTRQLEPYGRVYCKRILDGPGDQDGPDQSAPTNEQVEDDLEDEQEPESLLSRDPREWKQQDHYQVLGLSKLRYKATEDDVVKAFRRKVLKHHPDKKAALHGGKTHDDRFFKCIQKAYDILMDPVKRRQWDSVDSGVTCYIPKESVKLDADKFFEVYSKFFEQEARFWKGGKPGEKVPELGDMNTTKEEFTKFYDFWYNFESWRSFEYLDKEDVDLADNRDDKRWMERKNKAERARRKKEDNARLRTIVDQALKHDPRVQAFKQQERAAKTAKRDAKEQLALKEREEKERILREQQEEQRIRLEKEEKEKEEGKKSKEQQKKVAKKEKRLLKSLLKDNGYFVEQATPNIIEQQLERLDRAMASKNLTLLREELEAAVAAGTAAQFMSQL